MPPRTRRRRWPAVLAALLCCAALVAPAAARPRSTAPVGHAGRWLLAPDGRVLIVHGFNIVAKLPPYLPGATGIGADDAAFLAAHGFTAVRLGVILAGLEPAPGRFDTGYLAGIAATVRTLARYGIRSLLDFHQDQYNELFQGEGFPRWMVQDNGLPVQPRAGFPGNYFANVALNRAFDNFWTDSAGPGGVGLQQRFTAAWVRVARAFRGDPAVLGYDLLNEPWPGTQWPTCFPPAGCPVFDRTLLGPFVHTLVTAVHAADPTHLAFYEPALPFDYSAPTWLGRVGDARSGFDFHVYCLAAVGAPETPPTRQLCNYVEERTVANALSQSAASGDALLLSEFGATTDTAELDTVVGLADGAAIPWLEWAYCACGDPTGSSTEALVYDPRRPPTGGNVAWTTLAVLDEPYPETTAGTPIGYTFDRAADTFTYRYSTAPAGRHLAPGATTDIYTSPLHYPHGYVVRVAGAEVVSAPDAVILRLRARPGATTVTVTLEPRRG